MLKISAIACFDDNYIWVLHDHLQAIVIDPGAAAPVWQFLEETGLALSAVLITHRHNDHLGGVTELKKQNGLPIYGPAGLPGITHGLIDRDHFSLLETEFHVLGVPGHTREHLAYLTGGALFCGDTLFSAGCGRVFDNTWTEMFESLEKIAALPNDTLIYPAHEYTQANLRFAAAVEPNNTAITLRQTEVTQLRAQGEATVPTRLVTEKACNPFLRLREPAVIAAIKEGEQPHSTPQDVFCSLRRWKDQFR